MNGIYKRLALLSTLLLFSCEDSGDLVTAEMRELTTLDERKFPLDSSSADRFQPPGQGVELGSGEAVESNLAYEVPAGWVAQPPTQFREINMAIDKGGEVYLSRVGGGLLENLNRWYGQFGVEKISPTDLEGLERVSVLGRRGYLMTAEGNYNPGMGRPVKTDAMLIGAIADSGEGLITIKLIAPKSVATAELASFKAFCHSLKTK